MIVESCRGKPGLECSYDCGHQAAKEEMMDDKQIRETLGRIDEHLEKTTDRGAILYPFLQAIDDVRNGTFAVWNTTTSNNLYDILRALAERQAALEEIAKEIGTGILIASLDEYAKKLKRVGEIARNATKGGSDASKTVSRIRN